MTLTPDREVVLYWDSSAVLQSELPELTLLSFDAQLLAAAHGEGLT